MSTVRGKGEKKITLNIQDRSIKFYKTSGIQYFFIVSLGLYSQHMLSYSLFLSFPNGKFLWCLYLWYNIYGHTYFSKMLGGTFLSLHTLSTQLLPTGQRLLFIVSAWELFRSRKWERICWFLGTMRITVTFQFIHAIIYQNHH